ncbi:FecR domain-containing protein [Chitinophaga pollutisoli]|uniref:FecR domain-containing protein n=1 Tax=Chitinophaga pollutisoli TaxID=3133966 RepID=A0ABZ2YU14_9BACT
MQKSRLIELLAKKKAGSISLKEQFELSKWLQDHDVDKDLADRIDDLFSMEYGPEWTEDEIKGKEKSWNRIMKSMHSDERAELPEPKVPRVFTWRRIIPMSVASAILLCVAGAGTWYWTLARKEARSRQNIVGTEKGSRSRLTLPDGSKVWLNGDSRITYGASFGKNSRELTLTGEAYFDVVRDPHHPMIIKTDAITIKVLGTAFNVRAYPDEKTTATTLVNGKVQVSVNNKDAVSYTLSPDEKLIVNNESGLADNRPGAHPKNEQLLENITKIKIVKTDAIPPEAQWTRNKLVFANQPLHEVANILSRWYGVTVIVQGDDDMKAQQFTGIFENQNIQSVMESLQVAGGFSFKIKNDSILIAP